MSDDVTPTSPPSAPSPPPRRASRRAVSGVVDPGAVDRDAVDRDAAAGTPTPEPAVTAAAPSPTIATPPVSTESGALSTPTAQEDPEPGDSLVRDQGAVGRRLSVLTLVLVLVGLLGLGGAGVMWQKAHAERSTESARNLALVDTSLTNDAIGQVSAALNKLFTYDYQNPETTQAAASSLLVGDAATQYKTLFTTLQSKASSQKLTFTTKVLLGGVSNLTPTSAQLLVFVDQTSTRTSDHQTSTAAAQLNVAAVKQGSTWKISEISTL